MSAQKPPIKTTTQKFLEIDAIEDNLVVLKNNSISMVIKTTAINFGLLSEREQEATIFAYAHFLNSLAFQIQIVIHSQQKDISSYIELINQQLSKQKNDKLKQRTDQYRQFIKNTVKKNKILDKKFYIVVRYSALQLSKTPKKTALERAKLDLYPKRDHLLEQLQRIGLRGQQLTNKELVELFYNLYNPESRGFKFTTPQQYTTTLVESQSKIAPPKEEPLLAKASPEVGFTPISQPQSKPEQSTPPGSVPVAAPGYQSPTNPKFNVLVPDLNKKQQRVLEGQELQSQLKNIVNKTKKQSK